MARSVGAGRDIRQSVIVTGDGSSASLRFGDEFVLPLDRRQIAAPKRRKAEQGYNPLLLLVPDANSLPLVGRKMLLEDLRAWLDADADISVHTLIARAGTGKTRLAIELCKAVDSGAAPGSGAWDAGFIRPSDLAAVVDRLKTSSFDWPRPTLLVIDYAAAVHRELADWLDRLARETLTGKLRFLLLDREAPEGFGWWSDLTRPTDNRAATRRDLFVDPDRPQILPDLDPGEKRRALLEAALAATAETMGEQAARHALPAPGADSAFEAALASPRFGNPLNLAMAGLIAAERGPVAAMVLRRLDAARHLGRHELGRMARIAEGEDIDEGAMRHALGFNGLAGGLALKALRQDLSSELTSAGLPNQSAALAQALMQELPSPGTQSSDASEARLDTIQPDLIGEAVIVEALLVGPPDRALRAANIVLRAYDLTGWRAAAALMRLIQDYGHALEDPQASAEEQDVAQIVLGLLSALTAAIPDDEIVSLETLVSSFPTSTTILREAAAAQTQRLATIWRQVAAAADEGEFAIMARARAALWLNNLGNRLRALGQREAALRTAQEAADLFRELAKIQPEDFRPRLALSLNNLSGCLAELGQIQAALTVAQESLDLRRELARTNPDAYAPGLALSLSNKATLLGQLGQHEAALAAAHEGVDLYRMLAAAHPEEFTSDLALLLNNLGNRLSNLGEDEAALAATQESTNLRRALAAARPDAFTDSLASSLNNLSNSLSKLGRNEAALIVAQEAVELRRNLTATRPDVFSHDLAMSLSVLGDRLEEAGRLQEAVVADHESVASLAPYFKARPDVFAGQMATYLRDYLRRAGLSGIPIDDDLTMSLFEYLQGKANNGN